MPSQKLIEMRPNHEGFFNITIDEEGLSLIRSVNHHLNSIAVMGDAGSGKSFLLSALIDSFQEFLSAFGSSAVTSGADVLILNQLQRRAIANDHSFRDNVSIGLVDIEGIGSHENDYHAMLLTPFLITSRVLVFNIMSNGGGRFPSAGEFCIILILHENAVSSHFCMMYTYIYI